MQDDKNDPDVTDAGQKTSTLLWLLCEKEKTLKS